MGPTRMCPWLVAALTLACGCDAPAEARVQAPARPHAPAAAPSTPKPDGVRPSFPALASGQQLQVPAGKVVLGSRPGTVGRAPGAEADLVAVALPAFKIDRLPYPNDPAREPLTLIARADAAALCAEASKRLCSELEWERACQGPDASTFAMGPELETEGCQDDPARCLSGFGLAAMGTSLREWTASDAPGGLGNALRTAVQRGAGTDGEAHKHRCAARRASTPDSKSQSLGFRCCSGDAPTATYPVEPARPLVKPLQADVERLRRVLRGVPELASHADSFHPFSTTSVDRALGRGNRSRDNAGAWLIQPSTVVWSPTRGEEVWVLTGRIGVHTLLAALHPMPDGSFVHAASAVIEEPESSIALGVNTESPTRMLWTTCFGCAGEGGRLSLGDDGRVGLVYR